MNVDDLILLDDPYFFSEDPETVEKNMKEWWDRNIEPLLRKQKDATQESNS